MQQALKLKRAKLVGDIRRGVVRFQTGTAAVDHAAALVLGLEPLDVAVLATLWFGGPVVPSVLCARLDLKAAALSASLERLIRTGYASHTPSIAVPTPAPPKPSGHAVTEAAVETTVHARRWIDTIWGPLAAQGDRIAELFTAAELAVVVRFLERACASQEQHASALRALLQVNDTQSRPTASKGGLSSAALRRVQLFVEANLGEQLPLSELASRAGLSEFHFARAFKATTGVTPRVFVERRRVVRAQEWIQATTLPLAQIAVEVGFGSQSRMTTVFRRTTGVTPARYRGKGGVTASANQARLQ